MGQTNLVRRVSSTLGLDLPAGASDRLVRFATLLGERAAPLGLISRRDAQRSLERHVLDSLRAAAAVEANDDTAYDLGSGAGLPGLVVAIAVPRLRVRLVESRRRRAAFLELAVAELAVENASVVHGRIEELVDRVDLCLARALAPLPRCWELARGLLRPGGRLVYFAGERLGLQLEPVDASDVRLIETPVLESAGPLVIMTR